MKALRLSFNWALNPTPNWPQVPRGSVPSVTAFFPLSDVNVELNQQHQITERKRFAESNFVKKIARCTRRIAANGWTPAAKIIGLESVQ